MKIRTLLISAALVLAAGCASVNTVEPAFPLAKPDKVADKRVITDNTLNEIAYVVEVDRALSPGGLPRVQVKLQNLKAAVKNVNYRFQWFDAQGFALDDEATQVISIEGGDSRDVQDTATSPKAVDWKLTLSESVAYTPGFGPPSTRSPVR
jgi:uncharacterized protein YcfL